MKQGYKVLLYRNRKLTSVAAPNPVEYTEGRWVRMEIGNGPATLFADLESALRFALTFRLSFVHPVIYAVEYEPWPTRLPRYRGRAVLAWQGCNLARRFPAPARRHLRLAKAVRLVRKVTML